MTFRMEADPSAPGAQRYTLGCDGCGTTQSWPGVIDYIAWRALVARLGWKADWPERCPGCGRNIRGVLPPVTQGRLDL